MGDRTLKAGFGKATLWGCWETTWSLADEADARALVISDGGEPAAICVLDVVSISPGRALELRRRAAAAIGTAEDRVCIFWTHNHSVWVVEGEPQAGEHVNLDYDKVGDAVEAAARAAMASIQEAEIGMAVTRPEPALNFCRRIEFGDIGTFTFWFGYRMHAPGQIDCSHMMRAALTSLARGEPYQVRRHFGKNKEDTGTDIPEAPIPVPSPLLMPPAADDALQTLYFRTPDGEPIGSIIRFAAHPDRSSRYECGFHAGDYPVYARRVVEEGFGGTSLFLTGPCGNQTTGGDCYGEVQDAREMGEALGRHALSALNGVEWSSSGPIDACSPMVELPLRDDLAPSAEAAADADKEGRKAFADAVARGAALAELKKISDKWERKSIGPAMYGMDLAGTGPRTLTHPLFVLRMGDHAIASISGEPFGEYAVRLRRETIGERLLVAEGGNGSVGYIPTAAEMGTGGYESNITPYGPAVEDAIMDALKAGLSQTGL